jgi:dienelactone hydrolase
MIHVHNTSANCQPALPRCYPQVSRVFAAISCATSFLAVAFCCFTPLTLSGQTYGKADGGNPGDLMIQNYLRQETERIETAGLDEPVKSAAEWDKIRPRHLREFHHMLGLFPVPARTELEATITRSIDKGDYLVDMLHYQSMPGLFVTANLYRPAQVRQGEKLPAILYVCGHSSRGRNGNKTAFQDHGIWFARNGYVCLVVDTLQLGELAGVHHGTYREERWWWISRGYTPAGVETWNGIRGIDYLVSRPDVDASRIGVTGISGGGATTFWIAAIDERVAVAAPVSGMADLLSYIPNRVINGHCDCMFLYNTYQWPWTRIACMVAPRPMLFVNSHLDPIFPMDANERVINRLERFYSLFGAGDLVDAFVSIGGHDYRKDIRQGAFRFMNIHLKNDPRPVMDSERDLVKGSQPGQHPIPPEQLRVFPGDTDIPANARNAQIDQLFVPAASVDLPETNFNGWKQSMIEELRQVAFAHFPRRVPSAKGSDRQAQGAASDPIWIDTEQGISIRLKPARLSDGHGRVLLVVTGPEGIERIPDWVGRIADNKDSIYLLEPRGFGETRWTHNNPPNYVERSHYLLGRTVDSGRVWDIAAAARFLNQRHNTPVVLAGKGASGVLGVYAALLEPEIGELILEDPPLTHMDKNAPVLLNVLRVMDIPHAIGLLAPRNVQLTGQGEGQAGEERDIISALRNAARTN